MHAKAWTNCCVRRRRTLPNFVRHKILSSSRTSGEHRVLADVLLKNFVAAAVFSVSYFLNVVEEFCSCLSKPEESVCHFGGSYDVTFSPATIQVSIIHVTVTKVSLAQSVSVDRHVLLHFWVSLLKLLLFMLLFKYVVFLIFIFVMSQLISSYVFCMILAKFIELRTHLLIFDYS